MVHHRRTDRKSDIQRWVPHLKIANTSFNRHFFECTNLLDPTQYHLFPPQQMPFFQQLHVEGHLLELNITKKKQSLSKRVKPNKIIKSILRYHCKAFFSPKFTAGIFSLELFFSLSIYNLLSFFVLVLFYSHKTKKKNTCTMLLLSPMLISNILFY